MHGQIGFIEVSRLHVFMISGISPCAKNKLFSQNHGLDQKDFSTLHGTCMSLCAPLKTNITIQKTTMNEDVSPIKNGDVPYKFHCHVSLLELPSLKLTART